MPWPVVVAVRRRCHRLRGRRAVSLASGDTVVVSGAAWGRLDHRPVARLIGATVIGLASQANHEWLASHGGIPVT